MLVKNPKPAYRKWIKRGALTLFVIEGVSFAASYFIWSQVNTRRDYRKYLNDNYPVFLNLYYTVGETIDKNSRIRQIDYAYWAAEDQSKS